MLDASIPGSGGAGGGWDGTAAGTGEALTGIPGYWVLRLRNFRGGGGGTAIAYLDRKTPESNYGHADGPIRPSLVIPWPNG